MDAPPSRLRRLARLVAVDAALLKRRRELRLLLAGQTLSLAGTELTMVTMPFQVYRETHSTFAVGLLGIAEFVPILIVALISGALADAFDRRRLMRIAEAGSGLTAIVLAVNAFDGDPQTWLVYVCATVMAVFFALLRPAMDSLFPLLVERDELATAGALQGIIHEVAGLSGPALAGVLLAVTNPGTAYAIDAATFAFSLVMLAAMRTPPPPPDAEPPSLRGVIDGFRFARSRPELVGTYLVDINAMFFGIPLALFPAVAERYGGPAVLGLLYAAVPAGGLLTSLTSGWATRVTRHGRAVLLAAGAYGLAIVGFGLAHNLVLALVFLALSGAADMVSGIFRQVIWNQTIPDELRGRLASIEMLSWSSGPTLGTFEAGTVASATSPRVSIVSGGALCVAGCVVLALALRPFWDYVPAGPSG